MYDCRHSIWILPMILYQDVFPKFQAIVSMLFIFSHSQKIDRQSLSLPPARAQAPCLRSPRGIPEFGWEDDGIVTDSASGRIFIYLYIYICIYILWNLSDTGRDPLQNQLHPNVDVHHNEPLKYLGLKVNDPATPMANPPSPQGTTLFLNTPR